MSINLPLKIKSKHLSEEAKIIRREEQKLKNQIDWCKSHQKHDELISLRSDWFSLNEHRRYDVRNENRATFLARAYLAGKPYKEVEQHRKPENEMKFQCAIIPRIEAMVNKYGTQKVSRDNIRSWSKL